MKNNLSEKRRPWIFPLCAAGFFALLSVLIILDALHSDGSDYILPFIGYGGQCNLSFGNDFSLFGTQLHIPFFSLCLLLSGMIAACITSCFRAEKYGFRPIVATTFNLLFFLQAVAGAIFLAALENLIGAESFTGLHFSGLSTFGGLYSSLLFLPLVSLILRRNLNQLFDFSVPSCILLLSFARMNCFYSGCCGSSLRFINGSPVRFPVQLFEVAADYLVLAFSLFAEEINSKSGRRKYSPFALMMVSYCIIRFFLEFLRENSEVFHSGYSIGQIHCIIFLCIGISWCLISYRKYRRMSSVFSYKAETEV